MIPIEDRKKQFAQKLKEWIKKNDPHHKKYPKWLCNEFYFHWVEVPDDGIKMMFEYEKKWSTGGRLATFRSNSLQWHPKKWKEEPKGDVYKAPQTNNNDYGEIDYQAAKERMKKQPQRAGNIGRQLRQNWEK